MSIKPVGITFETAQGGIDVDWFQAMPDGRYLYHIPDTHRVVPVELLEVWERAMRYERFGEYADQVRAIIDKEPT